MDSHSIQGKGARNSELVWTGAFFRSVMFFF
jgi:hypothetical protein